MFIQLIYGVMIADGSEHDISDVIENIKKKDENARSTEICGSKVLASYGGGNNDGALFVRVPIDDICDGYCVNVVKLNSLNEQANTDDAKQAKAAFDEWWATSELAAAIRKASPFGDELKSPDFRIVMDSD